MRRLIEDLNRAMLDEGRGVRYFDRVRAAAEQFLRDVGEALSKEMQDAGYDTKRVIAHGMAIWATFRPKSGFKFAEPDFVPPKEVEFWLRINREGIAQCTLNFADPRGFQEVRPRNLIDDPEVSSPERLAGYLASADGRMDILGTWG